MGLAHYNMALLSYRHGKVIVTLNGLYLIHIQEDYISLSNALNILYTGFFDTAMEILTCPIYCLVKL